MKLILDPFILESLNEELNSINKCLKDFFGYEFNNYLYFNKKIYKINNVNLIEFANLDITDGENSQVNILKEKLIEFFKIEKNKIAINSYIENTYIITIFSSNTDLKFIQFITKIISSVLIKYIYEEKVNKLSSEVRSLKESLYLREREINTIYKLEKLFLENGKIENSIKNILEIAINTLNADNGSIALIDKDILKFYMISEKSPGKLINKTMDKNKGILGKAILDKKTIIVNDVKNSELWEKEIAMEVEYFPTAIIAAPIITPDKKIIGGLEILHSGKDKEFSKSDEALVTIFANQVGKFLYYKMINKNNY